MKRSIKTRLSILAALIMALTTVGSAAEAATSFAEQLEARFAEPEMIHRPYYPRIPHRMASVMLPI